MKAFLHGGRGSAIGEIAVNMELENPEDRGFFERGHVQESDIRRTNVEAIVTYADERREERPVAGPLTIHVCNRFMSTDCVAGPPLGEALIGRIVLEALDPIADCTKRTPTPRPESPDYPLLKLKWFFSVPQS